MFRRLPRLRTAVLAILTVCTCDAALAADLEAGSGRYAFDAFGTLGLVHSSEEQADFNHSALLPKGAGASDDWSPAVDSVLGLQLSARLSPTLSATVQAVSELRYDRSYRPFIEWAYLAWDVTPDLELRLGRTSAATFLVTDSRRVGYAQHWVRPPAEVYDLIPVTNNDGVDAIWHRRAAGVTHTVHLAAGRSEGHFSPRGLSRAKAVSDHQVTLQYLAERGGATFYTVIGRDRLTVDGFDGLMDAFSAFGPEGEAIARRWGARGKLGTYLGTGLSYDAGSWFAQGELARMENPSLFGTQRAGYVSAGKRLGRLTPYATLSGIEVRTPRAAAGLDLAGLPPPALPAAAALNAALNGILASTAEYWTAAAGLRWDFAPGLALKFQHERIDIAEGSWGPLTNIQPGYRPGGTVHVTSMAVSFVL